MKKEPTKEKVRTSDIYQAAYLLALGSSIDGLEVVRELDKDVCIMSLQGDSIQSRLNEYINNQAKIDPVLYQKAINRIKDIVFKAIKESFNSSVRGRS